METVLVIIISIGIVSLFLCVLLIKRNEMVADYRISLLNRLHKASLDDLHNRKMHDYEWRYKAYHKITYQEMFLKFWKDIDSFYDNYDFTKPRD